MFSKLLYLVNITSYKEEQLYPTLGCVELPCRQYHTCYNTLLHYYNPLADYSGVNEYNCNAMHVIYFIYDGTCILLGFSGIGRNLNDGGMLAFWVPLLCDTTSAVL